MGPGGRPEARRATGSTQKCCRFGVQSWWWQNIWTISEKKWISGQKLHFWPEILHFFTLHLWNPHFLGSNEPDSMGSKNCIFGPKICIFLRYTYETPISSARTVPTRWDHMSPISWGNSGRWFYILYLNLAKLIIEIDCFPHSEDRSQSPEVSSIGEFYEMSLMFLRMASLL